MSLLWSTHSKITRIYKGKLFMNEFKSDCLSTGRGDVYYKVKERTDFEVVTLSQEIKF